MKVLLVCLLLLSILLIVFKYQEIVAPGHFMEERQPIYSASSNSKDTIAFAGQIQPILVNHCSPCHFTGGKMYEKLPFDNEKTIIDHGVALLRRINDAKEKELIQNFIEEHKK